MQKKGILVTGGAGYIGSHVALMLSENGERVVVLDNLSTGFREAVPQGVFVAGEAGDRSLVTGLLREHDIDTVMHFAASTVVPDSVRRPLGYYRNNSCTTRNLLAACRDGGVRHFIFSSTAAVYGVPEDGVAREESPTLPINPYGRSKLMSEWMLRDLSSASPLRHVVLRYFNVAGCDPLGRIGQSTPHATLLIKVACETALGRRPALTLFGTDFPTPDGTGVRDYIHVTDLAAVHLQAIAYLRNGGASRIFNVGYGRGFSVREVIAAVERVHGRPLPVREAARRPGDPPRLIAAGEDVWRVLEWRPKLNNLDEIVHSALRWEERLMAAERMPPRDTNRVAATARP